MPESSPSADPIEPFDPLTEAGAAELRRRIDGATPHRVDRSELDGHVGLTSRELYELGVTVAPVGLRGVPSAVGGRVLVLLGALLGTVLLAMAAAFLLDPLFGGLFGDEVRRDSVDRSIEAGLGLAAAFGLPGWAGLALARFGARRVRAGLEDRRRSVVDRATPAADDPEARAPVAVIREPGVLRVSLLWLRGDVEDAALVELRTLAEERVPEDEPGRAEDAVSRLSEVALRADAGRTVPWAERGRSTRGPDGERQVVREGAPDVVATARRRPTPVVGRTAGSWQRRGPRCRRSTHASRWGRTGIPSR
jgi:hypothetical protein